MGGLLSAEDAQGEASKPRETGLDCKQFLREANGRLSDFYERVRDLGEGAYGEVGRGRG